MKCNAQVSSDDDDDDNDSEKEDEKLRELVLHGSPGNPFYNLPKFCIDMWIELNGFYSTLVLITLPFHF